MSERRGPIRRLRDWTSRVSAKTENFLQLHIFGNPTVMKYMPVLRGIIIYLWFFPLAVTLPQRIHLSLIDANPYTNPFLYYSRPWAEVLLVFAIIHSLILTMALYNRSERKAFLETHSVDFERKTVRREILTAREFWLELATLQCFFLLHPHTWGFGGVVELIPTMSLWHPILQKAGLCAIFFALTFYFELHARMDARVAWEEAPRRLMRKNLWQSLSVKKHREYHIFKMLGRLIVHTILYALAAGLAPVLILFLQQTLMIVFALLGSIWLWIILAFLLCWRSVTAIFTRISFVKKLKKECHKNGYALLSLHGAYRSVFFDDACYTFSVGANHKIYYCRLIACVNRAKKIYISPDGTLSRVRSIRIPTPLARQAGAISNQAHMSDEDQQALEIFRTMSSVDYTFEAEGIKVLILNPVARRVFVEENGKTMAMDNGSRVGEYKVYTGNAFLRALERDCVEK